MNCTCHRDREQYIFCLAHPFGPSGMVKYEEEADDAAYEPTNVTLAERFTGLLKLIEAQSVAIVDLQDQLRTLTVIVDLHLKGRK
jgi:hypothetical protein